MQFAIDENGVRTSINNSIKGKPYKCPCCESEVVQKKGDVMIWHFAHKSLADCVDYYDHKGEWHRAMQELFPENNREVYEKTSTYRHIFDILTDKGRIIEFQHSPMNFKEFIGRSWDYSVRSAFNDTPRPVWVFDFSERDFSIAPKQYDGKPRMRRFYWKRATDLFKNYNDFDGEAGYELWIYIDPYRRGEQIGEQYGYPVYEKKPAKKGFVRVLATYRECKTIVGNVYTEQEFQKYITSL